MLNNKVVLITGGTGSFGRKFTQIAFDRFKPKKLIIFSRDEYKQYEMAKVFPDRKYPIRYFLGDVRDKYRMNRAFEGVDYVIHAAALKQVPALEYNPTEAVKTNIEGANNIVHASIEAGIKKVIALSTDKAVNPVNLYGATKLVAEKIFIAANVYGGQKVKFSILRYGNVIGSRGSVIPYFLSLKRQGIKDFPLTDERMTRFLITLEQAVGMALEVLKNSEGGEVFVPKIHSVRVVDLVKAIEPECKFKIIGIRPGEKIHEVLISEDEARKTKEIKNAYVILPQFFESHAVHKKYLKYPYVPKNFIYKSSNNERRLNAQKLREIIKDIQI